MTHFRTRAPRFWLLVLVLCVSFTGNAQMDGRPLVVFIVGRSLSTASYVDTTAAGLSKLSEIISGYGAEIQLLEENKPIPKHASLVVIARPLRALSFRQAVYLWQHLRRGGNLLLMLDPENFYLGFANTNPQFTRSPLQTLITSDYGITMQNTFLVDPWFSQESIGKIRQVMSRVYPEVMPNPLTEPLITYELPVWVWGARSLRVEPFGLDDYASPFLYSDSSYGETNPGVFQIVRGRRLEPAGAPLELNLDQDVVGRLHIAAMSENTETGSRIILLGDSEIFTNGFGLDGTAFFPTYPSNRILAQRMIGWLLELPVNQWGGLLYGYTWIAVDGEAADWANSSRPYTDADAAGLRQIRTFHDDLYAYFLIETDAVPDTNMLVSLTTDAGVVQVRSSGTVLDGRSADGREITAVPEAKLGIGTYIEVRVPLRVLPDRITNVCISSSGLSAASNEPDCLDSALTLRSVNSRAPHDYSLSAGIVAEVQSAQTVNLRSGPGTDFEVIGVIPDGMVFAATGRNDDASWIQVKNSLYSGWMASFLLMPNGDFSSLPLANAESP